MENLAQHGQLMPAELTAQVREKYYFVDEDVLLHFSYAV